MKSQNEKIKNYLLKGKKLTPLQALRMFGCFRLSGRIYDLKKEGLKIKTDLVKRNKKVFAQYYAI